jgi:parvulin-like peptidyl-prolyl isomerase
VAEFYRRNRGRFQIPEMVRAAHIVKNVDEHTDEETALSAIKQVEAELAAGGVFEELADKHSDCPGSGGDLGIFPRGQMVQEFDDVVFALSPNETSPVFRTPFGFHIAKVYEVTAAGSRSLADARQDIEQELSRRKQTKVIEDFVDRLKTQADIRDLVAGSENIVSR